MRSEFNQYAPLVVFVYNRPDKTRTILFDISQLKGIENTDIYVMCDGPKNDCDVEKVQEVRSMINLFSQKKIGKSVNIIERTENIGLANSVISGINSLMESYERVIVLEDDLRITDDFLVFMNSALDYYKDDNRIFSIAGYCPQKLEKKEIKTVQFSRLFECWGWSIWRDRWNQIKWDYDFYYKLHKSVLGIYKMDLVTLRLKKMLDLYLSGKSDTWAVRVACYQAGLGKFTVRPTCTKARNVGCDGSGTNCGSVESTTHNEMRSEKIKFTDFSRNFFYEMKEWNYFRKHD